MGGFSYSPEAAGMLLDIILFLSGNDGTAAGIASHPEVETAWFPASGTLVIMNNGDQTAETVVRYPGGEYRAVLKPRSTVFAENL